MTQVEGFRLAPRQRHLWRLLQESSAFRVQAGALIEGELRPEVLERAFQDVVSRHDILRTTFHQAPGTLYPIQVIGAPVTLPWRLVDHTAEEQAENLPRLLRSEWERPFDHKSGPLLSAVLARLAGDRHLLVLTASALCADRRSLDNLLAEVAAAYESIQAGGDGASVQEAVQYLQYSEWHHELLADEESREGKAYWRQQEGNEPEWGLARGRHAGKGGPFNPRVFACGLEDLVTAGLGRLATELGAEVADVLLAAWQILLWRLSEGKVSAVGRVLDGRKFDDLAAGVGPYSAAVPFRVSLSDELTFSDVVRQARQQTLDSLEWLECFTPEDQAPGGREPQFLGGGFELVTKSPPRGAAGLTFKPAEQRAYVDRFALGLVAVQSADGLALELHSAAGDFDEPAVERLAQRLETLLAGALAEPRASIAELEIVGPAERRWLVEELNSTEAAYPREHSFPEIFHEQAERTPEAVAVLAGDRRLTYDDLAGRACQLARHLRSLGVGPETVVAIFCERSPELLVAILGTFQAGGSYVPLDAGYPPERLAYVLADAGAAVVLTTGGLAGALPASPAQVVRLDLEWEEIGRQSRDRLAPATSPEGMAYVIYTSGSTGRPKGVMVTHRGLVNYLIWAVGRYAGAGRGAPVDSPVGFDLTVTPLFVPLLTGRTVVLLPEPADLAGLQTASAGETFSLIKVTPAHLDLWRDDDERLREPLPTRVLVVGGDALFGERLTPWLASTPGLRVINEYGPTETVVGCCVYEVVTSAAPGPVPIGRPIANTRLFVVDRELRLVPAGLPGELCIAGDGVARGYLGRSDLTAERFVPDPFSPEPGGRMYRSGDLVSLKGDGNLEFAGRIDHQVKVRGFRIEPGEIEAALAENPAVREAVVVVREDTPGEKRLAAYVVPSDARALTVEAVRDWLAERLPAYMIPSAYVFLPSLPLTANGKVDRNALAVPDTSRPDLDRPYVAPQTAVQEILAGIWASALGLDRVGVHDNFFVLGGDSIRSVRIVSRAKERGLDFTVQDLFRYPTIEALAAKLETELGLRAQDGAPGAAGADVSTADDDVEATLAQLEGLSEEEVLALLKSRV